MIAGADGSTAVREDAVGDPTAPDRHAFSYQPALDGLRALSVLAVIAYHNGYHWAVGGFLGVDAFFVLSGFLITTLLVLEYQRAERIGLTAFWGRRVRRLLPALLLVLAFCAIYAAALVDPLEIERFRWDSLSSLLYVTNWRFIASGQNYFDVFATASPVRHLWSLAIEEQFYLVWPLVTLGCLRLRRGRTDLLAGVCVIGAAASAIAMSALYDKGSPSRAYYGTDTRAHTILIGALLALLLLRYRPSLRAAKVLQLAGAVALVAIFWSWHTTDGAAAGYYGLGSVVYAVGVAIVIAAAMQPAARLGRVLGVPPLPGIGRISYGLYLWHWPIIVWLPFWRVGFGDSRLVALRVAITFAAAGLSYRFVEMPIRHGRWFPRGGTAARCAVPVALVVAASVLLVGSAGAESPPNFMAGAVGSCPPPSQEELRQAQVETTRDPVVPPSRPPVIAVLGDSIACSLLPGLVELQREGPWRFHDGSVLGCGVASGEVAANEDFALLPVGVDRCTSLARAARRAAVRGHVPVALWVSSWERGDLVRNGRRLRSGSPAWRRELGRSIDEVIAELHRNGTHVVIARMPSTSTGRLVNAIARPRAVTDRAYAALDEVLDAAALRHPGEVTLVDLAHRVCPNGPPCPRTIDGIAPRAIDGGHYTPEGAIWALRWLLPRTVAAENVAHVRA